MDGEAWRAAIHGVTKSRTQLSDWSDLIDILVIETPFFNNTRDDSSLGHHQMFNTGVRFIILFVAEDGEALYSQKKQDLELIVAQIIVP